MYGRYKLYRFGIYKKKLVLFLLLFFALFASIGYSLLDSTLNINATTSISKSTWNVHFVSGSVDDSTSRISNCPSLSNCSIIESRASISGATTITFSNSLSAVNDYYEFTADIKNDGSISAMLYSVSINGITLANSDYIDLIIEYADYRTNGGKEIRQFDSLKPGETMKIKVKVLEKLAPSSDLFTNYVISFNYRQADENEVIRNIVS